MTQPWPERRSCPCRKSFRTICLKIALLLSCSSHVAQSHCTSLGEHPNATTGSIPTISSDSVGPVEFYQDFVWPAKPVILKGLAPTGWDDDSLVAQFGKRKVAYDLYKKERRGEAERDTTLKNFVAEYKGKDMYLIDEVPIPMAEKIEIPSVIGCPPIPGRIQSSVLWLSSGDKYSDEVAKAMDVPDQDRSAVDVLCVDEAKYPSLLEPTWQQARVDAGDCLYLPYGWYHTVHSLEKRNLAVNFWWSPSYTFLDIQTNHAIGGKRQCDALLLSDVYPTFQPTLQLAFLLETLARLNYGTNQFDETSLRGSLRDEHTGKSLLAPGAFEILDRNGDGILTPDEVSSLKKTELAAAFSDFRPGELTVRWPNKTSVPWIRQSDERESKDEL